MLGRVATSGHTKAAAHRWTAADRLSLVGTMMLGAVFAVLELARVFRPWDFDFYWAATDFGNLYVDGWLDPTYAYVYPPVLAQLLYPFHVLGHDAVMVGWTMLCFAALWWCCRVWTLPVIAAGIAATTFPDTLPGQVLGAPLGSVLVGNVQVPMAAAIVLGLRRPGWFAVPLLTKLTVGIGLLWYLFRREWRPFALGVLVTLAVAGASFLVSPGAWIEWAQWTVATYGQPSNPPIVGPPLPLRIVAGIALVYIAARRNWRWLVPVGCAVAIPSLYGVGTVVAVSVGALHWLTGWAGLPMRPVLAVHRMRLRDES